MVLTLSPIQANAAKKVKLNKSKLSLYVGKSYTLKLKNNKSKVKWTSSKKSVATVSSKGKVKAKKKGSCKITAKVGKKKYVCKVTVKKKANSSANNNSSNDNSSDINNSNTNNESSSSDTTNNPTPTTRPAATPIPNTPSPEVTKAPSITPSPEPTPTIEPTLIPSPKPSIEPTITPDYELHNPTVDDETSVWDLVEFGKFPQSLYTPIKEPNDPKDNVTYIDSNGTSYLCRSNSVTTSKKVLNEDTQTYETIYTTTTNYYYYKYEPIQWRVLNVSDNNALLLADKCLDYSQYNRTYDSVTWETCSLRRYLNDTFKKIAFSQAEQDILIPNNVINSRANPYSYAKGGNNTVDDIFLLDIYEMTKNDYGFCEETESVDTKYGCGISSNKRIGMFTDYSNDGGTYNFKTQYMNSYWWLRSPGLTGYKAAYINGGGCINYSTTQIVSIEEKIISYMGVRPTITINLEDNATTYSKVGTVDEKSNYVIY